MSDEPLEQAPVDTDKLNLESADTTDWEQQYKALQPEYTRNQQALKDAQSVWEDEQALIARIGEKFPHLIAEEDEPEVEDEFENEPEPLTRKEFEEWQATQQATAQDKENQARFEQDLNKFVGDRELDDKGDAWIKSRTHKGPEDLQESVDAWFEYLDSLAGGKRKKRPTSPLPGGKTATGVPDYSEMSRDQQNEVMAERARSLLS